MTTDDSVPVSAPEFQRKLATLLRQADREGVDLAGGWTCRTEDGGADWDVVVTQLESTET